MVTICFKRACQATSQWPAEGSLPTLVPVVFLGGQPFRDTQSSHSFQCALSSPGRSGFHTQNVSTMQTTSIFQPISSTLTTHLRNHHHHCCVQQHSIVGHGQSEREGFTRCTNTIEREQCDVKVLQSFLKLIKRKLDLLGF